MGPLEEQESFLMAGPFFQSLLFVLLCFEPGTGLVIFRVALNRLPHRSTIRKEEFALACSFRSYWSIIAEKAWWLWKSRPWWDRVMGQILHILANQIAENTEQTEPETV